MEFEFEKVLINAKIIELNRICDLIRIVFKTTTGEKIHLHLQCFFRIFDERDNLVVCSQNLSDRSPHYHKKHFKKYDWTEIGATVLDDAIKDNKDNLLATSVSSLKYANGDLMFVFENKMRIDVLINISVYDDMNYSENYRIFFDDKSKDHFVV